MSISRRSSTPSKGVTVRRAVRDDGARIIELDRELARFEKLRPPDDAEAARLLSWIFDTEKLEALVGEVDGAIEGIALFYETPGSTFRARPFLYLEDLVVSEAARSRGVGEELMAALAREALDEGGAMPCILNAADEVAVEAFLAGRLRFSAIPRVIEEVMGKGWSGDFRSLDDVLACDGEARRRGREAALRIQ